MNLIFNLFGKSKEKSNNEDRTIVSTSSKSNDGAINLDASRARIIILPPGKRGPSTTPSNQNWGDYWKVYNTGYSFYNRHMYQKAKDEFLKIYDAKEHAEAFFTHLLRSYRKLIDKVLDAKDYSTALPLFDELFTKCPNHTNSDVKQYNKVLAEVHDQQRKSKELLPEAPEFVIESSSIKFVSETKKPKGFKVPQTEKFSVLDLISKSDFLPEQLPYLEINNSTVSFRIVESLPQLQETPWRITESPDRNSFFVITKEDKELKHFDRNLNPLFSHRLSKLAEQHTFIRNLQISGNGNILLTAVDKAYVFDSQMRLISIWKVPIKDGLTKISNGSGDGGGLTEADQYLRVLELSRNASQDEIKQSFRKLALKCHPDKNPDDPQATEKMIELMKAYEYLTHEDARDVFRGEADAERWVKIIDSITFQAGGLEMTLTFSISMSPEDWIYGAGISEDGNAFYLGCYSGKTYVVSKEGIVEKVFIIPKTSDDTYGVFNPIISVLQREPYLYISTYDLLHVIKDDKIVARIPIRDTDRKWWKHGFTERQKNNSLRIYSNDGSEQGTIKFSDKIKSYGYKENLWVETSKNIYVFNLA